jgi:uncharacterized membrane protein YhaH (DUF805 family)
MHVFSVVKRWFSLQGTIGRREYLLTGVALMILKYAVEAGAIYYATGQFYSPLDFFNPLLSSRSQFTAGAPSWSGMAWVLWTTAFVWIAITMSVRRSIDVGVSPWAGMLVLVPLLNFIAMLYLASVPTGDARREYKSLNRSGHRGRPAGDATDYSDDEHVREVLGLNAGLVGVSVGFIYMFVMVLISVYGFSSYGAVLFFGTPIVAGAATAYVYNRWEKRSLRATLGLSVMTGALFAGGLLLMGLEGMMCIAMAAPIMLPLGILGALVGRAIAIRWHSERKQNDQGILGCLVLVPLLVGVESYVVPKTVFEVVSSVTIDAPPSEVWQCVVDFPEIDARPEWFFRWGIASPQRARIIGQGVGAVRHCEFTTGSFVEPITAWDEPRLLAFDVTEQPEPMFELTPYRHIHPPHLKGSFRSTRGEFRLVELEDGRTRLEGSTWYELKIYPHAYWTLWTDWLVHRIHDRVLRHIKRNAEAG